MATNVDLVVGLLLLGLASCVLLGCGLGVARRMSARLAALSASVALVLVVGFALALHGRLFLARLLPFSNVLIVGNGIPPGAAFLAGLVLGQQAIPGWRRAGLAGLLLGVALYSVLFDLTAPAAECGPPRFIEGICVQTSSASCSPCCAVSLLMEYEIPASEAEMMRLCLTRKTGTPELGLYRGLRIKTQASPWDVEVFYGDMAMLRRMNRGPALLLVETQADEPGWLQRWKPVRLTNHALVLYGFADDGEIELGDPSAGRVRWQANELASRWCGVGLRLVPRTESARAR